MKLDLHGMKHIDVSKKVDEFIWEAMQRNEQSVEIITGNSEQMKDVVRECVEDYGFVCNEVFWNFGSLIITLV
jgi:DNA-nicking Smr family endonuclease